MSFIKKCAVILVKKMYCSFPEESKRSKEFQQGSESSHAPGLWLRYFDDAGIKDCIYEGWVLEELKHVGQLGN